jgi:hypothetical protein
MNEQFIVDNQLYLNYLEINPESIPYKNENIDMQELSKLVEKQFRILARKYHPDYGGTNEDFKFLIECKTKILENDKELNVGLAIDDEKFESFDPESTAAMLGNQIFEVLHSYSEDLNIKAVHKPKTQEDEYEWIFNILDTEYQLSLNCQNLSKELIELSHSLHKDNSLNVLVCLFVPSKQMVANKYEYDNSLLFTFNDKIFLESSNSKDIMKYIMDLDQIKKDLENVKNGTFKTRNNNVLKTKKTEEIIKKEKQVIDFLNNFKLFEPISDSHAADFIKDL